MTTDLDRIRTTHAAAIANRQRGSFDSRDDDIGALLGEVERLTIVLSESIGRSGQAVVRQCVYCAREFTRFSCESQMCCGVCETKGDL